MELLIFTWIACPVAGGIIASRKKATLGGALLGLFLGPIGVIAAFALDGRPSCPTCQSKLDGRGEICPLCKTDLEWRINGPIERKKPREKREKTEALRLEFQCNVCQTAMSWPAYDSGRTIKCESCGSANTVPDFDPTRKSQTPVFKARQHDRLTECPDCNQNVSKRAETCPNCGCPLKAKS